MRKQMLVVFLVLLFFGSLVVLMPNAAACHNKTVSCSPTEKDIVDFETYSVEYEIDLYLTPGCGNTYDVGFTADPAPTGWARKVYEKGDTSKTDLLYPTAPPSSGFENWAGWVSITPKLSGSVHYYVILEVKVTDSQVVDNGDTAVITVHCWSKDNVPNDLEDDPVTTTTTLNIPFGIRMYHTVAYEATKWVYPGEWATFDITVKDIGNASGLVDLYKDTTSSPCLSDNWVWEFSQNPITLPENGTTKFNLKVKPPVDAEYGDFAIFIAKGVSRADPLKFIHSVGAKTIVTVPLPDISIQSCDMKCLATEPCDGDKVNISIDVWNLGDIAVSNFDLTFKLTDPGAEADITTITITDTLQPNNKINVRSEWVAIEGDHSICIHADEKGLIQEKDEQGNNEAGMIVSVGPAKPKSIVLTAQISPLNLMPNTDFTVMGEAKFNKEYNSLPVTNANVQIKILETNTIFNTQTDGQGKFTKKCTAPNQEGTYQVQVSINKEGISAVKTGYITVSTFIVDVFIKDRLVITGQDVKVTGTVKENNNGVADASVAVEIVDGNDNVKAIKNAKTDPTGFYSTDITSPDVTKYTEFTVKVTATKNDISGKQQTVIYVDIDTDKDSKANSVDEDDDADSYPDTVEVDSGTNPLDETEFPGPTAVIGNDITIDEGSEISLSGVNSYSSAGSTLKYTWEFGDNSDPTEPSSDPSIKYTYNADGIYTVKLTVKDEYGVSDSATITVTVNDLGPSVELDGPVSGESETWLTFKATASSPVDTIKSYTWNFGDGSTGNGETVIHQFADEGQYIVKVIVTDTDGSTAEKTLQVDITAKPKEIEESGDNNEALADNTVMFVGVAVVIIIVVLLALLMLLRKKKPSSSQPTDGRVRISGDDAQASRRPTTQFAEAEIKPAMGAGNAQQPRLATTTTPGTLPQRPAVTSGQQVQQLPPAPPNNLQPTQNSPQKQRDWDWNFNE